MYDLRKKCTNKKIIDEYYVFTYMFSKQTLKAAK